MRAPFSAALSVAIILTSSVVPTPVSAESTAPAKRTVLAFEFVDSSAAGPTQNCETYQGSFMDQTAEAMLSRLGVSVLREDRVSAFPDPALSIGSTLTVCRAPVVKVKDGKKTETYRSWQPTITEVLKERGVEVAEQDVVTPVKSTAVANETAVTIVRVAEADVVVPVVVPFTTVTKDDPTLDRGKTVVENEGSNGKIEEIWHERREDGVVVKRTKTSSKVTVPAVSKVILKGTKIVTYGTGIASFYSGNGVGPLTAAHLTLPKGTMVKVVNVANGKSVIVRINDRGPYIAGRIIDLSKDAFAAISSLGAGVVAVRIEAP